MTSKEAFSEFINNSDFEPDCQNKWDFDLPVISISSRGYDRHEKSFYVGYYIGDFALLEDELFDKDFEKLKQKVKKWYKKNYEKALKVALAKGQLENDK